MGSAMWSKGQDINGTRLYGMRKRAQRPGTLNVVARSFASKLKSQGTVVALVVVAAVAALAALVWYALAMSFQWNERFNIARLEISTGRIISEDMIRIGTGISEGRNIFSFNIVRTRQDLLQKTPTLKEISIIRRLPDTVLIRATERDPVARIGRSGQLVTDTDGVVFSAGATSPNVPSISGLKLASLRPGAKLDGMMLCAVDVIGAVVDARLNLRIDSIDADRRDYLTIQVDHEGQLKEVKLNWKDMERRTDEARASLVKRLDNLTRILALDKARGRQRVNITAENDTVYYLE